MKKFLLSLLILITATTQAQQRSVTRAEGLAA